MHQISTKKEWFNNFINLIFKDNVSKKNSDGR
jgi:hypothetical protein